MIDWHTIACDLIKEAEGCRLEAYPDPATGGEPWTVGWGCTGPDIGPGTVWTQEQADADLQDRLDQVNRVVTQAVRVRLTPQQRAALVDLAYNIGTQAFLHSTLLQLLNAGDYAGAAKQFGLWIHANGKVMPGLVTRRGIEAKLFAGGIV
jgi:lysozyme